VLYLFLSLMLSYLGCEEDDGEVVTYLNQHLEHRHVISPHLASGCFSKLIIVVDSDAGISDLAAHDSRMSLGKKFLRYVRLRIHLLPC